MTTRMSVLIAAALAAGACAESATLPLDSNSPAGSDPAAVGETRRADATKAKPAAPQVEITELVKEVPPNRVTLRLFGVQLGGIVSMPVRVAELQAGADGVPLPVRRLWTELDLADTSESYALATFDVPPGATEVEVVLRLESKGALAGPGGDQAWVIDGPAMHFTAPAERVLARQKLSVDLEVARSLTTLAGAGTFVLPHFLVRY